MRIEIKEVALLAEGVDRNLMAAMAASLSLVALLAEGVDRNHFAPDARPPKRVALLAEGVDRNFVQIILEPVELGRPPRRGRG